jgi:hypothetical protein
VKCWWNQILKPDLVLDFSEDLVDLRLPGTFLKKKAGPETVWVLLVLLHRNETRYLVPAPPVSSSTKEIPVQFLNIRSQFWSNSY